jgi:hypothetical protein
MSFVMLNEYRIWGEKWVLGRLRRRWNSNTKMDLKGEG